MSQDKPRRIWRRLRLGFRAVRFVGWGLILAVILSLLYLNQAGLPDFLKRPLQEELRTRGIELEFSKLRLRFDRGLVAEDVRIRSPQTNGPSFTIKTVQLELDWRALWSGEARIAGLRLRDGQMQWRFAVTNHEPRTLTMDQLQTELQFHTNDVWELKHFEAQFAGSRLHLDGAITNASELRRWRIAQKRPPAAVPAGELERRLTALADALDRIKFTSPPELRISLHGDLRDALSWDTLILLSASGADTPWGSVTNLLLNARLLPVSYGTNGLRKVDIALEAAAAATPWGSMTNLMVNGRLLPDDTNGLRGAELSFKADAGVTPWAEADAIIAKLNLTNVERATSLANAVLELHASRVKTVWAQTGPTELNARWQLNFPDFTNAVPLSGDLALRAAEIETRWGKLARASVKTRMQTLPRTSSSQADATWGPWRFIEPYLLSVEAELDQFSSPKLTLDKAKLAADWKAPLFELTQLDAQLYRGGIRGSGSVDVVSRKAQASMELDFDAQQIRPFLTPRSVAWLSKYGWENPPQATGRVAATLPAWTNRAPDWRAEVLPTLEIDGAFKIARGSFRGIPVESASSHVSYSEMVWRLPDLVVKRPEGAALIKHVADDRTRDYYFKFQSTIDPQALRPLVEPGQQRGFDLVQFGELPVVEAEVWGRWRHPELLGVLGTVATSNLTVRSETGLVVQAAVQYTNRVLTATSVRAWQGDRAARVDGLRVDFPADSLFLTNAASTVDPMVIGRAIGPKTAQAFEPYRFLSPPELTANGLIPMHSTNSTADLRVLVSGGPFEWRRIKARHISGTVVWQGDTLSLSNVEARINEGTAAGDASFFLKSEEGTRMRFQLVTSNANLGRFLEDVNPGRTNIQGIITGRLVISDAVSTNWQTWNGYGNVQMKDGLLWEVPLFGKLFSRVLDEFWIGLGSSRATEANATFGISNGVVHSEDMMVRTTLMRFYLRGDVTLDGKLNGRAEAAILRDAPLIGRAVSLVLSPVTKVLEYKFTGTLSEPELEPLYVATRMLLKPLHPFRTLKEIFGPDDGTRTKGNEPETPVGPTESGKNQLQ